MSVRPTPRVLRAPSPLAPAYPGLLLAGALAVLLGACTKADDGAGKHGGMPPPQVTVDTLQPRTVPLALELPATLAGSREVEIRARVAGVLEKRNFAEGGPVRAGQSLFTLESARYAAAVARQEADVAAAAARQAQAARNLARLKPLREDKAIAAKDYDDAVSAEAIAAADLKSAEARLRDARLDLAYTRVESPIAGLAGRALVSEGTLVPGPELLLTRVSQLDPIHVRFGLSEQEQSRLAADAATGAVTLPAGGRWQASVRLPDGSLHPQVGEVSFSDVRVSTETGTGEWQAVVPNPRHTLRPGQFVRVLLEGATRKDALVVPQRAVLDGGTGKFVYLAAPGKDGGTVAQPAPVEVGDWVRLAGGDNAWVIRKGLKAGDPVIVDGVARIFFPGMPVVVAGPQEPSQQTKQAEPAAPAQPAAAK